MSDPRVEHAVAHWLARFTVNGVDPSDYVDVTRTIKHWDEWCGAWSKRAAIHEEMGREALAKRQFVSAGEHLGRAAVTYHFGKYLFVNNMAEMKTAHMKAVECHTLALPHQLFPGERVMIPYEGKTLAGVLRKPPGVARPPVVLMTMGLDSTKEEFDTFEIAFLRRGMAILAFDGPGQGEAEYEFAIRHDYENVVGPVIDYVETRADLDASRVAVWGVSLGGYYAPRALAFEPRLKAAFAGCGPWDWAALFDTVPDLTRDAYISRSHSKTPEEAREKAKKISLRDIAREIHKPLCVMAGGLDRLCPPEDAERLAREVRGPCELIVIPDGNHVAHNRAYRYRPQVADWFAGLLGAGRA